MSMSETNYVLLSDEQKRTYVEERLLQTENLLARAELAKEAPIGAALTPDEDIEALRAQQADLARKYKELTPSS